MKVRLRTSYAGPKGSYAAGAVADFDQAEAYRLIEGGYAVQIDEPDGKPPLAAPPESVGAVETADRRPPQTAEAPANRRPKPRS